MLFYILQGVFVLHFNDLWVTGKSIFWIYVQSSKTVFLEIKIFTLRGLTPTVRATYLLVKCLEERIIATYFTLIQQPIYHLSFCGNLLASPTLAVHPIYPWWYLRLCQTCPMDLIRIIKPDPGQNSRLSLENLTWCLLTMACDTFTLRPRGFGPGLYKVWRLNTWLTPHTALSHHAGEIIVIQIFLGKMDEISWK